MRRFLAPWQRLALALPLIALPLPVSAQNPTPTPPPAAPAQPAPPPAAKPAAPMPKNLEPLAASDAAGVLGKKVIGPGGEIVGLVVDVVIDAAGQAKAAIIDVGGFLGVGSRKIAVDWQLLHFAPGDAAKPLTLSLPRAEIQGAPAYKPEAPAAEMVGPPPAIATPPDAPR